MKFVKRISWSKNVPKVQPGKPYQERGDNESMITYLTATKRIVVMRIWMVLKLLLRQRLTWYNQMKKKHMKKKTAGNKIIEREIESLSKQREKINEKVDLRQIFPDKEENINKELYKNTKDEDIRLLVVKNNKSI